MSEEKSFRKEMESIISELGCDEKEILMSLLNNQDMTGQDAVLFILKLLKAAVSASIIERNRAIASSVAFFVRNGYWVQINQIIKTLISTDFKNALEKDLGQRLPTNEAENDMKESMYKFIEQIDWFVNNLSGKDRESIYSFNNKGITYEYSPKERVLQVWRASNKIQAIKEYRFLYGCGLREAKDKCEEMEYLL